MSENTDDMTGGRYWHDRYGELYEEYWALRAERLELRASRGNWALLAALLAIVAVCSTIASYQQTVRMLKAEAACPERTP